jgi:hypothetical protein
MIASVRGSRAALLAVPLLLAACSAEAPFTPEPIDQPVARAPLRMNARIDGFVYSATTEAGFPVGGIEVNKGGVRVSATFANAGGNLTAPLTAVDFELRVSGSVAEGPLPSRVVYTADDAFGGSLYWIAPGQAVPVFIGLYQKSRSAYVLGPYPVTITRRPH